MLITSFERTIKIKIVAVDAYFCSPLCPNFSKSKKGDGWCSAFHLGLMLGDSFFERLPLCRFYTSKYYKETMDDEAFKETYNQFRKEML